MIITLIGMSNLGKTHWSHRLSSECGFEIIDCDTMVEAELGPHLQRLGYAGIQDVTRWMGFPFDSQYQDTSKEFVRCERKVMLDIINLIASAPSDSPLVIDTCGSIIYTGEDVLAELKKLSTIVYLEASLAHRQSLFEKYIAEPKPVVWGDGAFAPAAGEEPMATLKRCYPDLLQARANRYAGIAEVTIPFERHQKTGISPVELFPGLSEQ